MIWWWRLIFFFFFFFYVSVRLPVCECVRVWVWENSCKISSIVGSDRNTEAWLKFVAEMIHQSTESLNSRVWYFCRTWKWNNCVEQTAESPNFDVWGKKNIKRTMFKMERKSEYDLTDRLDSFEGDVSEAEAHSHWLWFIYLFLAETFLYVITF